MGNKKSKKKEEQNMCEKPLPLGMGLLCCVVLFLVMFILGGNKINDLENKNTELRELLLQFDIEMHTFLSKSISKYKHECVEPVDELIVNFSTESGSFWETVTILSSELNMSEFDNIKKVYPKMTITNGRDCMKYDVVVNPSGFPRFVKEKKYEISFEDIYISWLR